MISYEQPLYRPPCEAGSLIIQATLGCPHNRCTFCGMYKMKEFRVREVEEVKSDLRKARLIYSYVESIFLADGNTIAMNSDKLADIIAYARQLFPEVKRISSYGGARFLKGKSLQALRRLAEAGLDTIYFGLETGDDQILNKVNKGVTSAEMVKAALKVKEAGITLSVYILLGLGGEQYWIQHAENTAMALNLMQPNYIRPRTLYLLPGTPLHEERERGEFVEASGETIMRELRLMLEMLEVEEAYFLSDHVSNYIPVYGILPRDREKMLEMIDQALSDPERYLAPRILTHL